MRKRLTRLLGTGLSLLVAFGITHRVAAQTTGNRILFESVATQTGHGKNATTIPPQIYSMNSDGTDVQPLTSGGGAYPKWSHDHEYISMLRNGLQVMASKGEVNGGRVFDVVGDVAATGSDWSPDDTMISYQRYSTLGLWLVSVDAATEEVGTPIQVAAGWCGYPSWSPIGNKIAFTFLPDGASWGAQYVKVLDLDTGTETSFNMVSSAHPSWSPDGSRIAFDAVATVTTTKGHKTTTNYYLEVFIENADGSGARQVTNFKGTTGLPAWSPDGSSLALTREINGTRSIYRMDLGAGIVTLLHEGGQGPDWAP